LGATELKPVDHAALAKACGAQDVRIENAAEFLPAVQAALGLCGPTILDVIVDPNARPPVNLLEGKFAAPLEFTFS
jgi:acetolactate synthase-1/2/3 large subunit